MTTFWSLATMMAILALAFIALPLLRNRQDNTVKGDQLNTAVIREQLGELKTDMDAGKLDADAYASARHDLERELLDTINQSEPENTGNSHSGRWVLLILLPAVPLLAVALYQQLGAGDLSSQPPPTRTAQTQNSNGMQEHDINQTLELLEQRLNDEPEHPDGWMLLARSYTSLRRYDEAVAAYEQARKYGGDSPELLIDYSDSLIAANDGNFSDEAGAMLQKALAQQPDNAKGLWLVGHWHYQRGNYREARDSWQRVATQVQPGSENAMVLQQQIQLASAKLGETTAPAEPTTVADSSTGKTSIQVTVSLDPALRDSAAPDDTLFVFARAASGPRMPLAIVRKQVRDLPVTVTLDDSTAMSPAMKLSNFPQVSVGARISKTGQAMPAAGDLEGMQSPVSTSNSKDTINIVIDSRL